ncbi:MAG: hypothetical protein J7K68_01740 [Candidatus Diapherotrites archaeon]|nr:hypothetical protein [Candidatus Diapherotrites archaeon]
MDDEIKVNGIFCKGCPYNDGWYCRLYKRACHEMFSKTKVCPYMASGMEEE